MMLKAETPREKKNKRIGLIISVSLHAIIFLLGFMVFSCWRAPGPPWPGDVFIVDYGTDPVGSGDLKSDAEANESEEITESTEEAAPDAASQESPSEVTEPQETTEPVTEPVDPVETYDTESEHTVPEQEPQPTAPAARDSQNDSDVQSEQESEADQEGAATYSPSGNNNGDDENEVGDKGDPDSAEDAEVYEGSRGGGNDGLSVNVPGWKMEREPPTPDVQFTGSVKFSFVVNEDGEVMNIKVLSAGFPPEEIKKLENALYKAAFSQTSSGIPPEYTKGTLTWKIISR